MQKLIASFQRFMHNRYGMDVLGKHMMNLTLVLLIVNIFVQSIILQVLTLTLLIVANYRMFSKKRYKRASENRFYLQYIRKVKFKINKLKARKDYKYFNCPQCKLSLRAPRKRGEITVTCSQCKHKFDQKT